MSAKLVVTMLAASLLTVGCVAYPDDPYYRGGGYGYHGDQRYDRNDGRHYNDWERKRWEERQRVYEQQRRDVREQDRNRHEWDKRRHEDDKKHREWDKKRVENRDGRDYHHDD
ncbi:hypothetical protein I5515_16725 [Acinetobacter calcoaceticus]|uniref:hypothetical protein n=1 Tax=Acinetobacter calcoaceticus TaxID=471 RepID=UPI0018FFEEB5|nr:hypothetical protein [Acinetobacter calcoaceticus]MBJ9723434.1 hypothetical protein [Acinetobacter calcoaceticus]